MMVMMTKSTEPKMATIKRFVCIGAVYAGMDNPKYTNAHQHGLLSFKWVTEKRNGLCVVENDN